MTIAFRISVFTRAEVEKGQKKTPFSKDPEGVQLFPGGPNANFYRNPYNLWFSRGGVRTRPPPLDPHMRISGGIFVCFDSLRPNNNLSIIKGRVFLDWTSTKLGLMFLPKDTMQWSRWGSNQQPLGLEWSALTTEPLSSHIRWNDATLDLLNREPFAWFILTLSVKELTFCDLSHFVFAQGVK